MAAKGRKEHKGAEVEMTGTGTVSPCPVLLPEAWLCALCDLSRLNCGVQVSLRCGRKRGWSGGYITSASSTRRLRSFTDLAAAAMMAVTSRISWCGTGSTRVSAIFRKVWAMRKI